MTSAEYIHVRFDPCRCGCYGKDPWHARSFRRVVRDVVQYPEPKKVKTSSGEYDAMGEGVAKFPWGDSIVYRVVWLGKDNSTGKDIDMGWYRER